jgi:hypothetical protein
MDARLIGVSRLRLPTSAGRPAVVPKDMLGRVLRILRSHPNSTEPRALKPDVSQSLKSAGCIIVTDEPHNVDDPVNSGVISIKSDA